MPQKSIEFNAKLCSKSNDCFLFFKHAHPNSNDFEMNESGLYYYCPSIINLLPSDYWKIS